VKPNRVKDKLRAGQVTFGAWLTISSPTVAEIMALAGFDFVVIDTEHAAIDVESVQILIQAMAGTGAAPIVRVPGSQRSVVTNILDTGPQGVIFPLINSRNEAETAVNVALFPPRGSRSIGFGRAHGFDADRHKEYLETANDSMLLGIQIEHSDALARLNEVVTTPGIDLVFIGLTDLSGSLGHYGNPKHPEVTHAVGEIISAARSANIPLGIRANTPQEIADYVKQGFRFFHIGSDMSYLVHTCKSSLRDAKRAAAEVLEGID
jgi:4-hydroxy-2-oxoheptanedioate aldolase